MELEHAVTLGFIKHVPELGVYALFPVEARKTMAATVVNSLLRMDPHPDKLSSSSHIDTLAQQLGQAFSLPLEHSETMTMCLELYKLMLLNKRFQPQPVVQDSDKYVKLFLRHVSSVFAPRQGDVITHVTLCTKALDMFRSVSTQLGPQLSAETWEHVLHLVLAIADSLLVQPLGSVQLADQVQNQVLGLLYQVWFASGTQSEGLWQVWKSLMQNWRHRSITIKTWNAVLIGLSQRVLGITYKDAGTSSVQFIINHETIDFLLDDDHVLYCWFKTLHIMGDLEKIDQPDVYHVAMHGLSQLASMFTSVKAPLDGNSILHALGPHVLEAVTSFPPGRDMGKAVALDTVCKLFQSKAKTTRFHPSYLALYYNGLEQALRSNSHDLLSVVMLNSVHLLSAEFRGVRMLIPSLMLAVGRVLTHRGDFPASRFADSDLRLSSLRLLMQMLCLPKRFEETTFKVRDTMLPDSETDLPVIVTYADLNPHFEHILTACLESLPSLKRELFSSAFVYIAENLETCMNFAENFMLSTLSNLTMGSWPMEDMLEALAFFVNLSFYMPRFGRSTYAKIMGSMCSVMEKQKSQPRIMLAALHAAHCWLADGRWIYSEQSILERVWRAADVCLNEVSDRQVKGAAQFFITKLMNNLALLSHPERMDSRIREIDVLETKQMSIDDLYCFIFDDALYSIIKHPSTFNNITVSVLMRNAAGRFVWDAGINYFSEEPDPVERYSCEEGGTLPDFPTTMGLSNGFLDTLYEDMPDGMEDKFDELRQQVAERHDLVHELRCSLQNTNTALERPTFSSRESVEETDSTPLRMFLGTLGFTDLSAQKRLQWISPNDLPAFLEALDLLDAVPCRENYTIPVHYVPSEGYEPTFAGGSPSFYEFVRSVGWYPDMALHTDWQPELDTEKLGPALRYFGNQDCEVMFMFPSLAPDFSPEDQEMAFHLQRVRFCWCEDVSTFVPSFGAKIMTLAIHPYPNGLCLIRCFLGSEPHDGIAPLMDGSIVSLTALASGARMAAINLSREVNKVTFGTALQRRCEQLDVVINSHSSSSPFAIKFSTLFGTLREDQ